MKFVPYGESCVTDGVPMNGEESVMMISEEFTFTVSSNRTGRYMMCFNFQCDSGFEAMRSGVLGGGSDGRAADAAERVTRLLSCI